MKHSLTILTVGRNDDYDGNFVERLTIALNHNIKNLPEAEFVFVEWNPIPNKALVCEDLQRIFGNKVKYYVVHPDFHPLYCTIDDFLEYPPKNIAIRRATTDFILSINSDIILGPDTVERLKGPLRRGTIYRTTRIDIKPDYLTVEFPLNPKCVVGENKGDTNACGDFLLMDRNSWVKSTGYMEKLPEQRLHKDSELVWRLHDVAGKPVEFLGSITHWRHKSSWSACNQNRPRVGNIHWNFKAKNLAANDENWGLARALEENRDGITWLIPKEKILPVFVKSKRKDLISLITAFKPFNRTYRPIQRSALFSYRINDLPVIAADTEGDVRKCTADFSNLILINGIKIGKDMGYNNRAPVLRDLLLKSLELVQTPFVGLINSDILLPSNFSEYFFSIEEKIGDCGFVVYTRYDLRPESEICTKDSLEAAFNKPTRVFDEKTSSDLFISTKENFIKMAQAMPEFILGRYGWDNWIHQYASQQFKCFNGTKSLRTLHCRHDYGHIQQQEGKSGRCAPSSVYNIELLSKQDNPTIFVDSWEKI